VQLSNSIANNFSKYFVPKVNSDISRRLLDFLLEIVGANCNCVTILKACNQSTLAPAVLRLKSAIGGQYPYKDIRGGWKIFIDISDTKVVVTHKKWEQSFEKGKFQFQWEFSLVFDRNQMKLKSTAISITETKFQNNLIKDELLPIFQEFPSK